MSVKERIRKKKSLNFRCPDCGYKLDVITVREPLGELVFECCNNGCRKEMFYDANKDKWYILLKKQVVEPERM